MERVFLSVSEFCSSVGVGRTTAYALIKSGALEVAKFGRRTLITKSSIDALIEQSLVRKDG